MFKKLDNVKLERTIDINSVVWPGQRAAGRYPGPGWCRDYEDMTGKTWAEVEDAIRLESELLKMHGASTQSLPSEGGDLADEIEIMETLQGMDLGAASSVLALSAARCITFASCNGGLLGGHHLEKYPLVAFFGRKRQVPLLLECAKASGTGFENQDGGALQVYADDLNKMVDFAVEMLRRKEAFSR